MTLLSTLVAASAWAVAANAAISPDLTLRALPDAPNGYAPANVTCPSTRPEIRSAFDISPQEQDWLPLRRNNTIPAIRDFMRRAAIPGFDSDTYLANVESNATNLPNIGIAISGGGYRAMLSGSGAIAAFDNRTDGATQKGHLGGLLQSATYLSGLSGGSWLVGSLYLNNFTSVQEIQRGDKLWQLSETIFEGPDNGPNLLSYYKDVFDAVGDKRDAGFETSITDTWGRMLSYQFINDDNGGISYTFSSIAEADNFKAGEIPLPLVVADGRYPGEILISSNATVYEFNPWEMGSYDPTLEAFVPLKYVGSNFDNGVLPTNETCVAGFDNAGFVLGTSSSLFNQIILYIRDGSDLIPEGIPDFAVNAITSVLEGLGDDNNDIADWSPNPFYQYRPEVNLNAAEKRLTLVDGGEDLQNVPYHPLIQDQRQVDIIISVDSSADTANFWPDGASPIASYERSLTAIANSTSFPPVPDKQTFLNRGYNDRPTFFGCNGTNSTTAGSTVPPPLIVYIPSRPYVYYANISTFQFEIPNAQRNAIIANGYEVATMANSTRDEDWQTCLACAVMQRSWERSDTAVPAKCSECFSKFCWDGTYDSAEPQPYNPTLFGTEIKIEENAAVAVASARGSFVAAVVGLAVALVLF